MTRDEILALCNKASDVGSVKHADFIDYVVVVESRRKINGEWQNVENAYLAVDGKLAMANADHRKQSKRLDFTEPKVLIDNADHLTLQVTVTSEIYGTRHGIATSRKKDGTPAERSFNWEVAETSAIGRALAAMGYGLLPGAGLASAEDMLRTQATNSHPDNNGNGKGNGAHFCSMHQATLEPHGKSFAHRLKSGAWCYGTNNPTTLPVAKHSPAKQTATNDAISPSP
ncbi:hypothetical protein ANRL1_04255 [Anaerolineae bacterium]|nr:hypothetical protein ANRL1_04255 [Anaerolineae bacterium]